MTDGNPGMSDDLPRWRVLLTAALGFMRLRWRAPASPVVIALTRWMNSWRGLGAVVIGMAAQGFDVELKRVPRWLAGQLLPDWDRALGGSGLGL